MSVILEKLEKAQKVLMDIRDELSFLENQLDWYRAREVNNPHEHLCPEKEEALHDLLTWFETAAGALYDSHGAMIAYQEDE